MLDIPVLALAFSAGLFTLLSPCGYALLPGYFAYHLGSRASVRKAALAGLTSALGLIFLYTAVGVLATTAGAFIRPHVPTFSLVAAAIVMLMGMAMLLNLRILSFNPVSRFPFRRGLPGFFLYGIAYGFGGAGCTAPLFLALLTYAAASFELAGGVMFFISYGLGIGVPLLLTSLLAGEAKQATLKRINRITPWLHKIGGTSLLLVGGYLIYFYYTTYMKSPT